MQNRWPMIVKLEFHHRPDQKPQISPIYTIWVIIINSCLTTLNLIIRCRTRHPFHMKVIWFLREISIMDIRSIVPMLLVVAFMPIIRCCQPQYPIVCGTVRVVVRIITEAIVSYFLGFQLKSLSDCKSFCRFPCIPPDSTRESTTG